MIEVAASVLSADFLNLEKDINRMQEAGVKYLHFAVMDGRFVPNITFGQTIMKAVAKTGLPIDAHLMIVEPEKYIGDFAAAGAKIITVHAEACPHLHRTLQQIHAEGCMAGVALNPSTSPEALKYVLDELDMILVMTVNPGFGGQKLIPSAVRKIGDVRRMLDEAGLDKIIQVDGNVNAETAGEMIANGANLLVTGSAIFSVHDPAALVKAIKAAG